MPRTSPLRPEDPERLGGYVLTGRLGAGGQGVVFLAHGPGGPPVAVKLLHARVDAEDRRFHREVEAARRVAPFCTARVLDAGVHDDRAYIVSEYVDGVSLQEHVAEHGPRSGGALDRIAVGTATALAAIHRAGVVHRDVKPSNVLLGPDGPRVVDFGVSRLADATPTAGGPVGTPAYLAPEQLRGEPAGPPADMFSWALTVAFAASGRHAFTADGYAAVLARILYGTPDIGPLDGRLRDIVVACLAREPGDRPAAEDVLSALLDHSDRPPARPAVHRGDVATAQTSSGDGGTGGTRFPASGQERRRTRRRWPAALVAGAAVLAALGALLYAVTRPAAYDGTWSGVARYPSAGRVFPVELRLSEPRSMRWGADLHCRGRLREIAETGGRLVLDLGQVTGASCYPGLVTLVSQGDRRATIEVSRAGEDAVRYSGTITRTS
ncbi:hypothetical protein GCM10009530_72090 [Microbispora corallina]|uniref:Protein kinase domain-containing protein n=1 Tax=Microbispora corallina TaxID=83302 RepID=A0ABQ4G4N6_9ACTN|nr:serine/threonine-protein kinase [Microbispora corallina]GIH41943.1 hypothetical protein Mco01_49430 [Microbispora corallina]